MVAASNPLIKLLEIGKQHQSNNLYKLACDEINKHLEDEESLLDMKQMVKNGVNACIEYLAKIIKNKELTSSDEDDLILATNTNVERLFGLMKSLEPTKFNLRKELFSSLNCCKFNKCLPILSARDDWNDILDHAVESTKAHVNSLMEAEANRTIQKNEQLRQLEKLKEAEQNELERETELFVMNPELVPVDKKELTDDKFKKWKLLCREFQVGKDGRSINKNLYHKSLICYFYKERFDR